MISILRLGHRIDRDKRITTHVALVARAFGADQIFVTTKDMNLEESVTDVTSRFGGKFVIKSGINWKSVIRDFVGIKVHLTMYGEPVSQVIAKIPKDSNVLIIIGGEKVPGEVFKLADFNVSVTSQPHSEVAALTIFLDRYFKGKELDSNFRGEYRVIPEKRGKNLKIYNREECLKILNKEKMPEKLIKHTLLVTDLAVKLGKMCNADFWLITCGAMLHDIGRVRTASVLHGVIGAELVQQLGYPEDVARIVERHVGAGLDKEEALKFGIDKALIPETLEEKIVSYADNLIVDNKKVKLKMVLEYYKNKKMGNIAKKIEDLHKELSNVVGMDIDQIDLD